MKGRERLSDVPPAGFAQARASLVRELRTSGNGAEAKAVAALRKPPVALWIVNQLGRTAPAQVKALVAATARVRHAQAGGGHGDDLRESMREQREALAALDEPIAQAASRAGAKLTLALQRRVQATVQAAAAGAPEALRHGALEHELSPTGFEGLLGAAPAPPPPPRRGDDLEERRKAAEQERERQRRERELHEAEREAQKLEAETKKLEDAAARAEEAAASARKKADESRRAANAAAARALELRQTR